MATIYQLPTPLAGSVGVLPVQKYMVVGDNLSAVTTAGYLNSVNLESYPIASTDIINALYSFNPNTQVGTFEQFSVAISNGVITLSALSAAGEVTLPTIANHIATYTNTSGHLSEDPATAISGGNIQAGLSGTAGTLASFPGTASNGSLIVKAINNSGGFNSTISNSNIGQATVYSMPDAGNAVAEFLVGAGATPFVSGNLPVASGTAGLMADSGKSAASIPTFTSPTIANHLAVFTNTSGNLGEDAATAINGGNIQAGLSGTAGTLASFPATAANGALILAAVNNAGGFNSTISNTAVGQATVYSMPDPGAATANFIISSLVGGGNQHITGGGFVVNNGDIEAGLPAGGSAGTFSLYPATGSTGILRITAAANAGNTITVITNASMAGARTLTIPDPAQSTATFLLNNGLTAAGVSAGSWGNATPPTPTMVIPVQIGATTYYLPVVSQNT